MATDGGRLPACAMPCCGYVVNDATVVGGEEDQLPTAGDATVCFGCGAWARFTEDGVRLFTAEDLLEFPDEQLDVMRRGTAAIRAMRRAQRVRDAR